MNPFLPAPRCSPLLCLLSVLALSVLPLPTCQAQADIVPGRRIYTLRLGMTLAQAQASAASRPDDVRHQKGGITILDWDDGTIALLRGGRVFQVEISDENESTPDGIHGGDTLAQVRGRYFPLRHTAYTMRDASGRAEPVDIYDDAGRGIAFEFMPSNGIGSLVTLESVFVHVPGSHVVPEADLRFRKG
jgi:hypothetical protein